MVRDRDRDPPPTYPPVDLDVALPAGFPAVHEAYRILRDQKDMVCGAYALTYLLHAYGQTERDGVAISVDAVAAAAGTTLEPRNEARLAAVREAVAAGEVPPARAGLWYPHDHFAYDLATVEDEGGTSPHGLVVACEAASDGALTAIPVPACRRDDAADGEENEDGDAGAVQLTADRFADLLGAVCDGTLHAQVILNYNLAQTLAPASLLGHKYNLLALLTRWDDPDYFRRLNWDVGHFTTLAGRLTRGSSDTRYLLVRDSYRSFGWRGYHLQPEEAIHAGLVRADDHRDGGLLLVTPTRDVDDALAWLDSHDLETEAWDNGSAYKPRTRPFDNG
ncbi:hypothetical protein [Salinigranum sp.]|uniref:DUF6885 family protein n=1 Tax=Salinigranum sp. TaxID=1966351 RepID=UPI00356A28B5